ncbi:CBS domain-containing protein [Desulfuromonas sp. AOP6]|uniref:CBS domain-containing protein n=1 Tax=Desulfuromonas sp. AOP6 TaxID=1566351 RepID=UPI001278A40B|nr:CBS domain-containing protein [Desulfuromonas sp. AOP6]BCA80056.1 poly(A) polymerase [Desulfuromonas sp. AOP6]
MEVITTHVNADFDCLGSMIAARRLYPGAHMVFAGAQERNLREFLQEGEVDPGLFKRVKDIDLEQVSRLILVDVRQSDRIGPFGEVSRRDNVEIHIYDHHPAGKADLKGVVEHIEPVGSTVTVLTGIFRQRGIEPTAAEATMMMLGLYEDTGSLLFSSTTTDDYLAAAFLLSHGADLNTVADFLTQELTADQVALLHDLIESRTILNIAGVEVVIAQASADHFVGDLAVLAHKLMDMEGTQALIVVVRLGGRVFMVGRSRAPEVDMGQIFSRFGGGGHSFAASATVRDLTLLEIVDRLPSVLQQHVQPRWEARHLMSSPVKTIAKNASMRDTRAIFTRYNINALPVVDDNRVVGLITRQLADRAVHHGLAEQPVNDYMTGDFFEVDPRTPIAVLQEQLMERNQRFIPVVEEGRLVGAITRTDLLRHMISGARALRTGTEAIDTLVGGGGLKKRRVERMLAEQLPQRIQDLLRRFGSIADEQGVSIFAVGGFVRDLLLEQENLDIDIVVEGDGIAFAEACAADQGCRIRSHKKFGTAVLIFPDGFKLDIASARMEYYTAPGALPQVEHAGIKLDLYRRDFTINTLAIALNEAHYGELIDFFGAQKDLKEKAVRVLHSLSFVEDPTRIFRAIRFEQRLGFHLGVHTQQLLLSAVRMGFLAKAGGRRIYNELVIILKEAAPLPALLRMGEFGLLQRLQAGLEVNPGIRQLFERAPRILNWFELLYTGKTCQAWQVYFLCLLADLDHAAVRGCCERLDVPPRQRQVFMEERREGLRVLQLLERRHSRQSLPGPVDLHRWLDPLSTEILLFLMARASCEEVRRWISLFVTQLRDVVPLLNGHDLRSLGIPPGPQYKTILAALLKARLAGRVVTREDELAMVRKRFLSTEGDDHE